MHQRLLTSTKGDLLQVLITSSFGQSRTKYKLSTTLTRKNGGDCQDQLINQLSNLEALFPD
jgi:hypothetical protein